MRPKSDARVMMDLDLNAMWATCQRLQTAAAIVDEYGSILVSGRNGVPKDMPHCVDLPDLVGRCFRCVHAERNALNQAARTGVNVAGHYLYTLYRPCVSCANDIVATNISAVYYRWDYDSDTQKDYVVDMFRRAGILSAQLPYTSIEQEFTEYLLTLRQQFGLHQVQQASKPVSLLVPSFGGTNPKNTS